MVKSHYFGHPPPWIVRDGLLECRDDDTLLEVRPGQGGVSTMLWCWRCKREFRLMAYEVDRLRVALEDTRKATTH